jgi:hypothetical protein
VRIDVTAAGLSSYTVERQDAGTATPEGDGVTLQGNAWKVVNAPVEILADTVLEFDLDYEDAGEILAIGLVKNGVVLENQAFQLAGSQKWGIQDARLTDAAAGTGNDVSIELGRHFTGQYDGFALIVDDDTDASAIASFSDLYLIG